MWVNGVYSLWPGQEMHLIASQPTWPTSPSTSSSSTSLTSSTSTSYPSYTVYPRHCQAERAQNNQGFHSVGNSVTILKLPQLHSAANNITFFQSLVALLCEPDSAGEQDLCFLPIFKSLDFLCFLVFLCNPAQCREGVGGGGEDLPAQYMGLFPPPLSYLITQ